MKSASSTIFAWTERCERENCAESERTSSNGGLNDLNRKFFKINLIHVIFNDDTEIFVKYKIRKFCADI